MVRRLSGEGDRRDFSGTLMSRLAIIEIPAATTMMPTKSSDLEQRMAALEERLVAFERQLTTRRPARASDTAHDSFPFPDVMITGATWHPSTEMKASDVDSCLRILWAVDDSNGIVVLS